MKLKILFLLSAITLLSALCSAEESYGEPDWIRYTPDCIRTVNGKAPGYLTTTFVGEVEDRQANFGGLEPQENPWLFQGTRVLLILHSSPCFKFIIVLEDSDHEVVEEYTAKPYYPQQCIVGYMPSDYMESDQLFATHLLFDLPNKSGDYYLQVYDYEGALLLTGKFTIIEGDVPISNFNVTWEAKCTIEKEFWYDEHFVTEEGYFPGNYNFTFHIPYPLVIEEGEPGYFTLTLQGTDMDRVMELINGSRVSLTTFAKRGVGVSVEKAGNMTCTQDNCTQNFSVTSTDSTNGIVEVRIPNDLSGLIGDRVTIVEKGKIKQALEVLETLKDTAVNYSAYYYIQGYYGKAILWNQVKGVLDIIIAGVNDVLEKVETGELTVNGLIDLLDKIRHYKGLIQQVTDYVEGMK